MPTNWYPQSMDGREAWHVNFADQIRNHGFGIKYGLTEVVLDEFDVITVWYQYWVPLRHTLDAYSQQVTGFFNTIAGRDENADLPSSPTFTTPRDVPPQPKVGIEKFTRDIARQIKNSTIYATADGDAMGIESTEGSSVIPADLAPVFKAQTREAFDVGVTFKKQGFSAARFEYRHKGGGAWLPAGVVISSPGSFTVAPMTPDTAEQIEIRAIYMQGNENIGQWSSIVPVLIAP